jgi:prepilin-type N-terminal cleavage/methylation domain-containing protein
MEVNSETGEDEEVGKRPQGPNGFTLIELVVSLFIIATVMAISLPNLRTAAEKAQSTACESNQRLLRAELENYYLDYHVYPSGSSSEIIQTLYNMKYLQSVPVDPDGGIYTVHVSPDGQTVSVSCSVHGVLGQNG